MKGKEEYLHYVDGEYIMKDTIQNACTWYDKLEVNCFLQFLDQPEYEIKQIKN
jgi:hypothetical protein